MTQAEAALRIFCASLSRADAVIDLYPALADKQIRTSFALAANFLAIEKELANDKNTAVNTWRALP